MHLQRLVLAGCLLAPGAALAQPAMPDMKLFAASADVQALIAKAKADLKPGAPMDSERLLSLAPYGASLEYRPGTAPASVHAKQAELMVVVQGSGIMVSGGTLTGANPAGTSGSGVAGGVSVPFTPGAVAFVPENTPHQMIPDAGNALVVITFKVPRPVPGS
jgi:mannose-6-phosphate isomerase-like protein (cupin superfamily)